MSQNNHVIYYSTLLTRYKFYEKIGEGAYGAVYRGYDTNLKKFVAIKEHRKMYDIILQELDKKWILWKRLDHPNIVKYIDYWLCGEISTVYVIMEYINGHTLHVDTAKGDGFDYYFRLILKEFKPSLYNNRIWDIMFQCIDGLNYLHSKKIVHRDIKPANIVLTTDNIPKIVDLDLTCIADDKLYSKLKCDGSNIGTPIFKAPEYILNLKQVTSIEYMKNDIWAMGATLYYYYFGHDYLKEKWRYLNIQEFNTLMSQLKNNQIIKYPKNNIEIYINWMLNTNFRKRPSSKECYNCIKNMYDERIQ